mmetsp:Transcript_41543/g.98461  ORF Transcript_41543/g.98461 Transcript_41543/m.98461 type:complete len:209 (+) Transcript_41543:1259-1885(+)
MLGLSYPSSSAGSLGFLSWKKPVATLAEMFLVLRFSLPELPRRLGCNGESCEAPGTPSGCFGKGPKMEARGDSSSGDADGLRTSAWNLMSCSGLRPGVGPAGLGSGSSWWPCSGSPTGERTLKAGGAPVAADCGSCDAAMKLSFSLRLASAWSASASASRCDLSRSISVRRADMVSSLAASRNSSMTCSSSIRRSSSWRILMASAALP